MKNKARRKYKKYSLRTVLLISAFAAQAVLTAFILIAVNRGFPLFWVISFLLSAVIAFIVVNQEMNPDVKLALVIPILLVPVLGGYMYLLLSRKKPNKELSEQEVRMNSALAPLAEKSRDVLRKLEELDETAMLQFRYLCLSNNFPVYENTAVEYLSPGERFFESLKEKLGTAEKFIYMEYFILQEGVMWNEILRILVEKAKAGVDVRLIYDDMGCLKLLPDKYDEQIRALGIGCRVYNHLGPLLSAAVNMRDHRKITVVDGRIAFTGGINLADEYINENRKLRYWKDAAIMLEGDAAQSFAIIFLSLWDSLEPAEQTSGGIIPEKPVPGRAVTVEPVTSVISVDDMTVDGPYPSGPFPCLMPKNISYSVEFGQLGAEPKLAGHSIESPVPGFVAPYADIPSDREPVGENVYLNLISGARKYIHICTPYFIPGTEMLAMLFLAAKNGVDVKIVTPVTPDNWNIHLITRSYYRQLIENGIEVYEYSPGFIHSKTVVSDQKTGVVGSVNFDFRSLFFHHECAVFMYGTSAIAQMDRDFEEILGASRRITLEECLNGKASVKIAGAFLRLFSPLF
ncbi:MAG TPA: phospholipase D-like domain-containing protein [Clostridia bacterium]|nr:phospholipase D-like domain-containing protein [Clostridia bacterium]